MKFSYFSREEEEGRGRGRGNGIYGEIVETGNGMASTEAVFQGYTWMALFLDISSRINFSGRFEMKGYFSSSFRSDYATSRYVRFIRATSFFFFFFSIDGQTIVKERKSEISRSVRTTNKLPVNSNRRGSWMLIARPSWTI